MPKASTITSSILMAVLLLLVILPGYSDKPAPERPKKGFWQVRDVVWPIRRTLYGLVPANPQLLTAYQIALVEAWFVAGMSDLLTRIFPNFANAMSPTWLILEGGAVGLFLGRASGFWSADRKLKKEKESKSEA